MAEYADTIKKLELRTLEVDIEKNIIKINGDDLRRCKKLVVTILPEKSEIYADIDTSVIFSNTPRKYDKRT